MNQLECGRSVDYNGLSSSGQPRVDGSGLLMRVTALFVRRTFVGTHRRSHDGYCDHVTFPFV